MMVGEVDDFRLLSAKAAFDVGDQSSFNLEVARQMLAAGFPPDVVSTDIHFANINGPVHNLLVTMSQFLCLGMSQTDVLARVTSSLPAPSAVQTWASWKWDRLATVILEVEQGSFPYHDSTGWSITGTERFVCRGMVVGGKLIERCKPHERRP
jgi:dihydroorotase